MAFSLAAFFEGNAIYSGSAYINGWVENGNASHTSESLNGTDLVRVQTGSGGNWIEGTSSTLDTDTWATSNDGDWTMELRMKVNNAPNGIMLWLGTGLDLIQVEVHNDYTRDYGNNSFNVAHTNNNGQFHTWRIRMIRRMESIMSTATRSC